MIQYLSSFHLQVQRTGVKILKDKRVLHEVKDKNGAACLVFNSLCSLPHVSDFIVYAKDIGGYIEFQSPVAIRTRHGCYYHSSSSANFNPHPVFFVDLVEEIESVERSHLGRIKSYVDMLLNFPYREDVTIFLSWCALDILALLAGISVKFALKTQLLISFEQV